MSRSGLRQVVAAATVAAVSVSGVAIAHAQENIGQFNITNITDFHGYIAPAAAHPGAAMLKCAVDRAAGELPQAFVSSGDNIGGTPFSSAILDDEPTIAALNEMGLDFSAVGNHEFDKGYADVTGRVTDLADFPLLGANVEGGSPELAPYGLAELDGVDVAFIGSVTAETERLVAAEGIEGIIFTDPLAATNRLADELVANDTADVVVALYHEGITGTEQWSENVDIVFSGHTHMVIEPTTEHGPLLMQAGNYGHNLADVNLSFNHDTQELTVDQAQLLGVAEINACGMPDPTIQQIVAEAEELAADAGQEVVATVPSTFYRGRNEGGETGSNHGVESQLNHLVAEAVRWSITNSTGVTADIGLMNAGGLRADLMGGEVTYAEAFEIQPFAGENSYVTISGADFKAAMEQQWKEESARPVESLGVSDNVSYTYDITRDIGDRITAMTIDGEPLDPERDYVVAGSVYLLSGNDGFTAFTRGTEPAQTGIIDVQSTIDYLAANEGVTPRSGQSHISVTPSGEFIAGEEITLELGGLSYTQGDTATTVTVSLGDAATTAPIEETLGEPGYGEAGQATVTLTVPAGLSGEQKLRVTTDVGTDITQPIMVSGVGEPVPGEETPTPGIGSSQTGSSALTGVLGALAGVIGTLGLLSWLQPNVLRQLQEQLQNRINQVF